MEKGWVVGRGGGGEWRPVGERPVPAEKARRAPSESRHERWASIMAARVGPSTWREGREEEGEGK